MNRPIYNNNTIYTKIYESGRLTFRLDVRNDFDISLTRLPEVDVHSLPEPKSFHEPQLCSVYHRELVPEWAYHAYDGGIEVFKEQDREDDYLATEHYNVSEYIGRESASDNLDPDKSIDGFLDYEIQVALNILEQDKDFNEWFKLHYFVNKVIESK